MRAGVYGPTVERIALAERVAELRAEGLHHREIAQRLALTVSYASALWNDPDGSKARSRKDSYAGVCVDCGGPTSGGDGRTAAPKRCETCSHVRQSEERIWTAETVVDAIRRFAAVHGRPPTATEWIKRDFENDYPARGSVYRSTGYRSQPFAAWADAIEAAGYERPDRGRYDRCGEQGVGAVARLVLASLRDADEPLGPQAIGRPVGLTRHQVGQALNGLLARGLVERIAHGKYAAVNGEATGATGRAEG